MFGLSSNTSRREVLAAGGAVLAVSSGFAETVLAGGAPSEIRPFNVQFPEDDLVDLRRRVKTTRWPEREKVNDATQGVRLGTMQELARYWVEAYDWRQREARLNSLPQFITEIDGLDIHFIHVRSKPPDALPIIITHGWPGSV